MIVCCISFAVVILLRRRVKHKKIFRVLVAAHIVAITMFLLNIVSNKPQTTIQRNSYGQGEKTKEYIVSLEGALEQEEIVVDIGERQYTHSQVQEMFKEIMEQLDDILLGENKSLDHVENDLNFTSTVDNYPVNITWELDSYDVLSPDGKVKEEKLTAEGTLVEVKGILSYGEEKAVYVTNVVVYPKSRTGKAKWIYRISKLLEERESSTRQDENFLLPTSLDGRTLIWKEKADLRGYYILILGFALSLVLVVKDMQEKKERKQKRQEALTREYPELISKFALLLSTGINVKNVWQKIIQSTSPDKVIYEEMQLTIREMQSGIAETVAYEKFGKRCEHVLYMKFGAMLSQNLKKGSKGLSELLKLEAIQAFEERKSYAKRMGEEASTKLLVPMFAMLAIVLVIVIIPAFLSIQL